MEGPPTTDPGIDPHYAKGNAAYAAQLAECRKGKKCPFCPDTIAEQGKIKMKHQNGGWGIFECSWPYENAAVHLIIVGNEHKTEITQVTGEDWPNIISLIEWAKLEYNMPGFGLAVRSGDSKYTGAEIRHIHFHLITPTKDGGAERSRVVSFPIG